MLGPVAEAGLLEAGTHAAPAQLWMRLVRWARRPEVLQDFHTVRTKFWRKLFGAWHSRHCRKEAQKTKLTQQLYNTKHDPTDSARRFSLGHGSSPAAHMHAMWCLWCCTRCAFRPGSPTSLNGSKLRSQAACQNAHHYGVEGVAASRPA